VSRTTLAISDHYVFSTISDRMDRKLQYYLAKVSWIHGRNRHGLRNDRSHMKRAINVRALNCEPRYQSNETPETSSQVPYRFGSARSFMSEDGSAAAARMFSICASDTLACCSVTIPNQEDERFPGPLERGTACARVSACLLDSSPGPRSHRKCPMRAGLARASVVHSIQLTRQFRVDSKKRVADIPAYAGVGLNQRIDGNFSTVL